MGTWKVFGGVAGRTTYAWMDGGFFLVQHIDIVSNGRQIKGMEMIWHVHPMGGEPEEAITSRFYGNSANTLDYVYELEGETLTIWGGAKGSPEAVPGSIQAAVTSPPLS